MKYKFCHFFAGPAAWLAALLFMTAILGSAQSIPTLNAQQLAFLTLINNYRAQNGAGALQVSIALENSSQWMSNDMATKNYFSHTDSLGRDPFTRMAAFGYPYGPAGENIAAGFPDAQSAFNAFESACDPDSSGTCTYAHRQNMLNPSYVVMGIGYSFSSTSTYGYYWATDFGGFLDQTINLTSAPPPTIASFTAVPTTITSGQSATLMWSVSGATSVSLSNGIGDVSTVTSHPVAPTQSTTYTLTATNTGGSTTATATITVQPPPDTQPPSAPVLIGAVAKSSAEVDLSWAASVDNVGVAGYQITRNGAVLASVSGTALSYADTGVGANSTYTYLVKAYDAAGNYSSASNSVQVTTPVASTPPNPPPSGTTISIWPNTATAAIPVMLGGNPMELGMKFRSDVAGQISGIRFYKGNGITGTHTGSLWSETGTLLATGTFTNETLSGWQVLQFSSPVAILANTTYVASYHTDTGAYSVSLHYFLTQGADNAPLHALESGVDGPDGVYMYSSGGQFPVNNALGNNYWVDVLFGSSGAAAPPPPATPQSVTTAAGSSQSATEGAAFAVPLQARVLDGSSSPLSGITVTFTAPSSGPSAIFAGGAASVTAVTNTLGIATAPALTANNSAGTYAVTASVPNLAPASFTLTNTAASGSTPPPNPPPSGTTISIWPNTATAAIPVMLGGNPMELGMKFRSDVAGQISGIQFYKGNGITGTHTGSLWSETGTLLATGTFTNETLSGWQVVLFNSPVAILANTTYVASYHTDTGAYSVSLHYFLTEGADNAPLHALESGVDGPDGVYMYSSGGQFPVNNALGNNYWVDVLFQ